MKKRQTVFQTEWFSVEQESFEHLESTEGKPYYKINSPDGVIMLVMTCDEKMILVRQFRPALNQYTLEFPSGFINEGESPQEAARRELKEETGYVCTSMEFLSPGRIMMNRHNCRSYAFYGTEAVFVPDGKKEKGIEVILSSASDFKKRVLSGEFEQFPAFAPIVLAAWKTGCRMILDA
ncbi:MAG: NUDIX hydrolase [Sedimentisphaerales bacterium]|nr:NUDIX hydrolase [Sedimentisphaerales bacterium]